MGYTDEELSDIYYKNEGYCWHCEKKLSYTNYGQAGRKGAWEVDHSRPKSKGGTDYFRNLVPSCIPCNRAKGGRHSSSFDPDWKREDEGCFIATAAYASSMTRELHVLRLYRDRELSRFSIGRFAIRLYYRTSPSLARLIAKSEISKALIRLILDPLVSIIGMEYDGVKKKEGRDSS